MLWGHLLRSRIICSPIANWVICILQPHPWGWLNWKLVAVQSRDVKSFEGRKKNTRKQKGDRFIPLQIQPRSSETTTNVLGETLHSSTVFLCVSAEFNFVSFPLPSSLVNSRLSPYHYEEDPPPHTHFPNNIMWQPDGFTKCVAWVGRAIPKAFTSCTCEKYGSTPNAWSFALPFLCVQWKEPSVCWRAIVQCTPIGIGPYLGGSFQ